MDYIGKAIGGFLIVVIIIMIYRCNADNKKDVYEPKDTSGLIKQAPAEEGLTIFA